MTTPFSEENKTLLDKFEIACIKVRSAIIILGKKETDEDVQQLFASFEKLYSPPSPDQEDIINRSGTKCLVMTSGGICGGQIGHEGVCGQCRTYHP